MQDRREADQAEEHQIAQEQTQAEEHLEARVLHRSIRELPTGRGSGWTWTTLKLCLAKSKTGFPICQKAVGCVVTLFEP